MTEYQLIYDYKQNEKYKESFNELAKQVFDLDFKNWYDRGCWNDYYICYSYVDKDRVIANVSVNKMHVIFNGKEYKAIQLGTVMTHPDYRQQGLAAKLTNHVIEKYEKDYDFIYLFANETVLDFYPKFGFVQVQESSFSLNTSDLIGETVKAPPLRKLDVNNQVDFELMEKIATERTAVSSILGVKNNGDLLMFYFIIAFNDAAYYIEEEETIVIFEQEGDELHIYDVISRKKVNLEAVLNRIVPSDSKKIIFHFTPDSDLKGIQTELIIDSDDQLFIRPLVKNELPPFLFPLTSHA